MSDDAPVHDAEGKAGATPPGERGGVLAFLAAIVRFVFFFPFFTLAFLIAALAAYYQMWLLVAVASVLGLAVLPLRLPAGVWLRPPLVLGALVLAFVFRLPILADGQARIDALAGEVKAGGPGVLGFVDCAALYSLGLAMAAGGFVAGYPEAAMEHALLHWPGPLERRFEDDFPLRSAQVRRVLQEFEADLVAGRALRLDPPQRIALKFGEDPQRIVLAINPIHVAAWALREGERWRIEVEGKVPVRYPPKSRVPLFTLEGRKFFMEEGLYHALQERGWLHPYTAVWAFSYAL